MSEPAHQVTHPSGVGMPDGLQRLWMPHRMAYLLGENKPEVGVEPEQGCPFCLIPEREDEDGLVVARGQLVFAVLNLYPYNNGHLLVCPYRHVADFTQLTPQEYAELAQFTQLAMQAVRRVSAPHGFNLGINQGEAAGAGIAAHLHQHVVPRWNGDNNFMTVIGQTKVLAQILRDTRQLLADAWHAQ